MSEQHTYHLEKYHGIGSRHKCPECGDKSSFSYYVDEDGEPIDASVGRCNHESSCGYHYTPKQFFSDNETYRPDTTYHRVQTHQKGAGGTDVINHGTELPPSYIDKDYVYRSLHTDSHLMYFLCNFFDTDTLMKAAATYYVGTTKDKSTIWWQVDQSRKVRTGKIIQYDPNTGHRIKSTGANWVHSKLNLPDFHLKQCLFGLHLITIYYEKPVALVESEKSAFICSMIDTRFVWLACGGKSQLTAERLEPIKSKRIVLYPDIDGMDEWSQKADALNKLGFNIRVSNFVQDNCNNFEHEHGGDIADVLLRQIDLITAPISELVPPEVETITAQPSCPDTPLETMVERNTSLQKLINKFSLIEI